MKEINSILAKKANGQRSLIDHLRDVMIVAVKAASYWGLDIEIAKEGALLHDIGKASPIFQDSLNNKRPEHVFRHEIASLFFLSVFPTEHHEPIIEMVIGHHKSIYNDVRGKGILDLVDHESLERIFSYHSQKFDEWSPKAVEILRRLGVQVRDVSVEEAFLNFQRVISFCEDTDRGWSNWRGLLTGSDHYASALNDSTVTAIVNSFAVPDLSYYSSITSDKYPLSLVDTTDSRKHTLLTAPTGSGKTHFLLKRCKQRVFYMLPFQASINAMFERIKNDINDPSADIRLLHSSSKVTNIDGKIEESILQDKFGASIKVLTPHQVASIAFGIKGYESTILDLQGCDVILDEIHTYSDVTQAIVLKIVEILKHLDCRIHVGTATMPSVLYNRILSILGDDDVYQVKLPDRILAGYDRHIVNKLNSYDDMWPLLDAAVKNKKKILVVCNTVARSQQLFAEIDERYQIKHKLLLHSRFRRNDRKTLEKQLMAEIDKSPEVSIVVATQVVEVSLDISFDVMFTDAAPLDSLIQRFGRINRRRKWGGRKLEMVHVFRPPDNDKDMLPYKAETVLRSYKELPTSGVLQETKTQNLLNSVYPEIEFSDINLSSVFEEGQWKLKKLWHKPKSALLEQLQIDSVSCIREIDIDEYLSGCVDTRLDLEIPVNFRSVGYRRLSSLQVGNRPFIIPSKSYCETKGLMLDRVDNEPFETSII